MLLSSPKPISSYTDRQAAEYQVRAELGRIVKGKRQYTAERRLKLLKLHSAALKGKYSIATRVRILETQLDGLVAYLETRPDPIEPMVYKDLIELLSIVCTDEYPEYVLHQIWDLFIRELRSEGSARAIAGALVKCDTGDVYLILRHLAVSHILAWSPSNASRAIKSVADARHAARRMSFAWNTYDGYRRATEGFHELIQGMLLESPTLVHSAFDDTRLHLLWLKYLPTAGSTYDVKVLNFARAIDDIVPSFLTYPKRLRPELSLELESLILFISTRQDESLALQATSHITDAVSALDSRQKSSVAIDQIFRDHPSLNTAGALAHATLPFLLFAARLLRESRTAAKDALDRGIIAALCRLWSADFPLIERTLPGKWVPLDKRHQAMRIATGLVLGALASHPELHPQLADTIMQSLTAPRWFWDAAGFTLALRAQHPEEQWCIDAHTSVKHFAFHLMQNHASFPGDSDREAAVTNDYHIVWLLQTSGEPGVDSRLRTFALDVLIYRIMAPAASWSPSVAVLLNCRIEEEEALRAALSEFIDHFLRFSELKHKLNIEASNSESLASSSRPLSISLHRAQAADQSPNNSQAGFMSNPLDRFVMFISNASRRNVYVAKALAESNVLDLVLHLLAGRFDASVIDVSSKDWRRRTCTEILAQKRMQA